MGSTFRDTRVLIQRAQCAIVMDSVDEMPRARAWRLPRAATEAACKLRPQLRGKRLAGLQFRRPQRLGPYYANCGCLKPRLSIELKGGPHVEQTERDAARTAYLVEQGYGVLGGWHEPGKREPQEVWEAIYAALTEE